MNINTTPRRQATPTTSLGGDRTGEGLPRLDKRERAVSRRALEGQRQQRAEQQPQQQQRAAGPRPVKDRGDSGTSLDGDRTGEGLPRLDRRERAVSRRALEEQRQQRAEQQQQQLQRAAVPRSVKARGDPRTNMSAMGAVFEVSAMSAMRTPPCGSPKAWAYTL
jgi:hypothetical protein